MMFGQVIYDRGDPSVGLLSYVGFETRRQCAESVARSAFRTNMKPPYKWQFWRVQWTDDVLAEYHKFVKSSKK